MNNNLQHKIAMEYWLEKTGRIELSEIGATTAASADQGQQTLTFSFSEETTRALKQISKDKDAGIYVFLLAALQLLIHKYAGTTEILIATPAPLLSAESITDTPLFLMANINPEAELKSLLIALQQEIKETYHYRDYIFEQFKEKYENIRGSVTSLFGYGFAYLPFTRENHFETPGKLNFTVQRNATDFTLTVQYAACYTTGFINGMARHFLHLLSGMLQNPAGIISAISLLPANDRMQVLETFNQTQTVFSEQGLTVNALFEQHVSLHPAQVAIKFRSTTVSYEQLYLNTLKLATLLNGYGTKPGHIVALICDRSELMVTGMLGIMKSGAAYLPVDSEIPDERISYILEDSAVELILTNKAVFAEREHFFNSTGKTVLFLDDIQDVTPTTEFSHPTETDPAYVIYTSGSTGRPKGISILHQGLSNLLLAYRGLYQQQLNPEDRCLTLGTISFDVTIPEIFGCLTNGATLIVLEKEQLFDAEKLAAFIVTEGVTCTYIPPVLLKELYLHLKPFAGSIPLKKMLVGVEAIQDTTLYDYAQLIPGIDILNAYGPTEITAFCTTFTYLPVPPLGENIPIGKPIPNSKVYILDDLLQPLPPGVSGELCVSGIGVAAGYLNNPELTAAKFIDDPFCKGARLYRTGDLAKWTPDGQILFIGRKDNQVKVRGYRIELGEIESALNSHPQLKEAVVCALDDEHGIKYLCAYVVPSTVINITEIRTYLSALLPEYMVPSRFMEIPEIPVTSNGKTDRKRLPRPESQEKTIQPADQPSNEVETRLVTIWESLLAIQPVGVNDNFFELGGHSLKAAKLITTILHDFKVEVPLRKVFSCGTIKNLAVYIQAAKPAIQFEIPLAPIADYYPVSFAQRRIYLSHLLNKNGTNYNMPVAYAFKGRIDLSRFEQAFTDIIKRQEAFRTTFALIDGIPLQKIHDEVPFEVQVLEASADITQQMKDFVRPFDLDKSSLMRVTFIRISDVSFIFLFDTHHIISDGVSIGLLMDEFRQAYEGVALPPLKVQYKDYAGWLNGYRDTAAFNVHRNYWISTFSEQATATELPLDYPRPDTQNFAGEHLSFQLDPAVVSALKKVVSEENSTLFLITLAAYQILLSKYSGQQDVIVGTPVAGRIHAGLDELMGMFVNTLPLKSTIQGETTFSTLLSQLKTHFFEALDHQIYPFEELIENLQLERITGRNPLFDTLFAYQNLELEELTIEGIDIKPLELDNATTKFDLSVDIQEHGADLHVVFTFSTALFKRATIEKLANHYQNILSSIALAPQQQIRDIALMDEQERKIILSVFNNHERQLQAGTMHGLFATQVSLTPDATAIRHTETILSYATLDQEATQLALILVAQGLKPGAVVAVLAERNENLLINLLAILKAGGVYLPVDPEYPLERIAFMLEDTKCAYALVTGSLPTSIAALFEEKNIRLPVSGIQDINGITLPETAPEAPAYIIYTSGSTGMPKGVQVAHQSFVNMIQCQIDVCGIEAATNCLLFASPGFDVSLSEIFLGLLTGATLIPASKTLIMNPAAFGQFLSQQAVTVATIPPSYLSVIDPEVLAPITTLITAGEVLNTQTATRYKEGRRFFNAYGPTETAVYATFFEVSGAIEIGGTIPIGKPIYNTRIYILDGDGQPCPAGINGEICITGAGLALGYLNREALSAEKFVHISGLPETRIYRTGDLGRWLPDGNIAFAGRKDDQLKINGYRIEPGEIESLLLNHPEVQEAIIAAVESSPGNKSLVAYFTSVNTINTKTLKSFLSSQLPAFMVPAYFIQLETFPLTANGKINRKALPKPAVSQENIQLILPENKLETQLLDVWKATLEIETIGTTHNFFDCGGHSLKALVLVSRIQKEFHIEVSLKDIFSNPTVQTLAAHLNNAAYRHFSSITPVSQQAHYPLSSAQKRIFVMSHFKGAETTYNMYSALWIAGPLDLSRLEQAITQLIHRHESLRTSFHMVNDEPVQIIHDHAGFILKSYTAVETDAPLLIEHFVKQFDLSKAPLFRAEVATINQEKHLLLVDLHHIIADGVSLDILVAELWALYEGKTLPALVIQYKDYAAWQQSLFETGAMEKQRQFWMHQFTGTLPLLELPLDFPRPLIQGYEGNNYAFDLETHTASRIHDFVREKGITLNMFMLAVYNILLSKYGAQEDVIVGTPVAGRTHADLEPVIGMFVNTLALRNYPTAEKTFNIFLDEVSSNALAAYENQDYPFEELIESLQLKRDTSRNPLFSAMFMMMNAKDQQQHTKLKFSLHPIDSIAAKFDLTFEAIQTGEQIEFLVNYNTALFTKASIERLSRHFTHLILQVLDDPSAALKQFSLPDAREIAHLKRFGGVATLGTGETIPELWQRQVQEQKDRIVIQMSDGHLTYNNLEEQSTVLAGYLQRVYGIKRGDKVALIVKRTLNLPVALLAIMKLGATYVPVDPLFPAQRIAYMLSNGDCSLIVTDQGFEHELPVFNLNRPWQKQAFSSITLPPVHADDGAYMIYTSGSTGAPKAVLMTQGNVVAMVPNLEPVFGMTKSDRILALTNITFDLSITELLCCLIGGMTIVLANDQEVNDFELLARLIDDQQVNILQMTPTRFAMLLNSIGSGFMAGIKSLLVGGEPIPKELFHTMSGFTQTRAFNCYGPSETCIWSTSSQIVDDHITMGVPLIGEQVMILDANDQLQPINVRGEICIAGSGVGKGYYKNEALTAAKFFRNPALSDQLIYRSGDMAKWLPDGRIQSLGRTDHQIKLRGYRIELGEIENALGRFTGIRMTAAILTEVNKEKQIVAFYEADRKYSDGTLRSFLAEFLPNYMLPVFCLHVELMPLTSSGKIDRKQLEPLVQQQSTASRKHEVATGPLQQGIAAIWKDILNVETIGITDNFFEVGGNSIRLIQVLNRLKKDMNIDLPLATAFKYATIRELSDYINSIAELGSIHDEAPYLLVNPGKKQFIFCFPPFIGYSFLYTALADYLPDYTLCCFHFQEHQAGMETYLNVMKELQPEGPFILLGYSVGGNFAYHLAQVLESEGKEVSDLVLIDSYKRWKAEDKPEAELKNEVELYMKNIDLSLFAMDAAYFESVKEKAYRKMLGYSSFMNDKTEQGTIAARIHLLRCEERMDTPIKNRNWEASTNSSFILYEGKGNHQEMLNPECIDENAVHLQVIMQQLENVYE